MGRVTEEILQRHLLAYHLRMAGSTWKEVNRQCGYAQGSGMANIMVGRIKRVGLEKYVSRYRRDIAMMDYDKTKSARYEWTPEMNFAEIERVRIPGEPS